MIRTNLRYALPETTQSQSIADAMSRRLKSLACRIDSNDPDPGNMSDRHLVVLGDDIDQVGIAHLRRRFGVATTADGVPLTASRELLERADALVVRVLNVNAALMDQMPRLKLIAKHGTGTDNVDIAAASARGILVANTPGANSDSVAEGTIALMLAVLRRLSEADRAVRTGNYVRGRKLLTRDLTGGHLGLVGFGQIARRVARIAQGGFSMHVTAFDPHVDGASMVGAGVTKSASLPSLLTEADVISLHVPLSSATRHLIGTDEISLMKPTAILVNTARGGVIDEAALIGALRSGRIGGAALDVYEVEPPTDSNPLYGLPNLVLSPHIAGVTVGSLRAMALQTAELIESVFDSKPPSALLNPEVWLSRRR